ncbi:S-layer homology domain-containing protein [Candidatus Margulisiibacteriota bacterium]
MKAIRNSFVFILLLLLVNSISAADIASRVDPLLTVAGAQNLGLGMLGVSHAYDAYSIFTNPSGLGQLTSFHGTLFSTKLLDTFQYNAIGVAFPFAGGTFGFGYAGYGVDSMDETVYEEDRIRTLGSYSAADRVIVAAFGLELSEHKHFLPLEPVRLILWPLFPTVRLGFSGKIYQQEMYDKSRQALGADIGLQLIPRIFKNIQFGINFANSLEPKFEKGNGFTEDETIERDLRFGVRAQFFNNKLGLLYESDSFGTHYGTYYHLTDDLAIRGGMRGDDPTLGVGYIIRRVWGPDESPYSVGIDYALLFSELEEVYTHVFSITVLGEEKTSQPLIHASDETRHSLDPITIQGTSEPESEITLYNNRHAVEHTQADVHGNWIIEKVSTMEGINVFEATAKKGGHIMSDYSKPAKILVEKSAPHITADVTDEKDAVMLSVSSNVALEKVIVETENQSITLSAEDTAYTQWHGTLRFPEKTFRQKEIVLYGFDTSGVKTNVITHIISTPFLTQPIDKTVVDSKLVTLYGKVHDDISAVYINDEPVTIEGSTFAQKYYFRTYGKKLLRIRALDTSGKEIKHNIRLLLLPNFEDVPDNHWGKNDLKYLTALDYYRMERSGKIYPRSKIRRAEMAAFLTRIVPDKTIASKQFPNDVASTHWAAKPISSAVANNFMTTQSDGSFRPNGLLQRWEVAVILDRALDLPVKESAYPHLPFEDVPAGYQGASSIKKLWQHKIIANYHLYRPDDYMTRAELAGIMARIPQLKKKIQWLRNWEVGFNLDEMDMELMSADEIFSPQYAKDGYLSILSPRNNIVVYSSSIRVKGKFHSPDRLMLNGVVIYSDERGHFSRTVPLKIGRNTITAKSDKKGVKVSVKRLRKFADVHSSNTRLNALGTLGLLITHQGSLNVNAQVQRGELAEMMRRVFGLQLTKPRRELRDVPLSHPYHDAIQVMVDNNYLQLTSYGKFLPAKSVTRGDLIRLFVKNMNIEVRDVDGTVFTDVAADITNAAYIEAAARYGLVPSGGTFRPYAKATNKFLYDLFLKVPSVKRRVQALI